MELATNAGTTIIEEEADVTGFGKVVFSRDAITNIFVWIYLKNVCRVTYDYANQDSFVVYMDKKQVRFQCNDQGLYIYKRNNRYLKSIKKVKLRNTGVEKSISQFQTNSGSQLNTVNNKIEGFTEK